MKRLLILTVLAMLLAGSTGCRFMECLWRGPACRQQAAPAVVCPTPCPTYNPCDPCAGTTVVAPAADNCLPGPTR
jgi:hypothetical protein